MALVYLLRNPLKPDLWNQNKVFYVGMSVHDLINGRPLDHLKESKKGDAGYNPHKNRTIQMILRAGLQPEVEIVAINISKDQAAELEIFLIDWLGRRCVSKTGILCNITKGGDGNTSNRTAEDLERLKRAGQKRWEAATDEDRKSQGQALINGLRDKLANDPEFRERYGKSMSKIAIEHNVDRIIAAGKRERTEVDRENARKMSQGNIGSKRLRCSCVRCQQEVAINVLAAFHGEGKCGDDMTLRKDATGNKGNYVRARVCCAICQLETIIARLPVHLKKTHGIE